MCKCRSVSNFNDMPIPTVMLNCYVIKSPLVKMENVWYMMYTVLMYRLRLYVLHAYYTFICLFVFDCAHSLCIMLGDDVYSHYSPIYM